MYNKHYIRLDSDGYIIHAYSDAFEPFLVGDICIEEHGARHIVINGETNPSIKGLSGAPIYKYENGKIIASEKQMPPQPKPITEMDRISALENAVDELMGVVLNG